MNLRVRLLTAGLAFCISLAATVPASAVTVIKPILGGSAPGGAFQAGDVGTIAGIKLLKAITYDFTFKIAPNTVAVLSQLQASFNGAGPQPISFTVWSGTPAAAISALYISGPVQVGPSLTNQLDAGSYFLKVNFIAKNNELLTGGLDITAVPEPDSWVLMIAGFGLIGVAARRRSASVFVA